MNRNENNDFQNKNHYADFDRHGNPLTGNRNSLSRYNPGSEYSGAGYNRENYEQQSGRRDTNATRAYGDFSRGTRYGEGGSTQGGGSSYGHSYYGLSGNVGPRFTQHDLHGDESRRYDAYGDTTHYDNRDRRFSDSFGRSSDGGYINENRSRDNINPSHYGDSYQGSQYRNSDPDFDREYGNYSRNDPNRGNSRDMDRDRIDYSNRGYMNEGWRSGEDNDRYYGDQNQGRSRYDRNREW